MKSTHLKRGAGLAIAIGVLGLMAFAASCGAPPQNPAPTAKLSGFVFQGRVAAADIHAYALEGVERGRELGNATTAADGTFTIEVRDASGPVVLVASGGTYEDESTGDVLALSELSLLMPQLEAGAEVKDLRITPVSHLAAGLALFYVKTVGFDVSAADSEAWKHLNNHFGNLDWRSVEPLEVATLRASGLDSSAKAGIILAGFSAEARTLWQSAQDRGTRVTADGLVGALYEDLHADGFFDGVGAAGALSLPVDAPDSARRQLDGSTVRSELSRAIGQFLVGPRNRSAVSAVDALPLRDAIALNDNPKLFRTAGAKDDVSAPIVTFTAKYELEDGGVFPSVGAGHLVAATILVSAEASDESGVTSLAVANGDAVLPPLGGSSASRFNGVWFAGDSGFITFRATAADTRGNSGVTDFTVYADLDAPIINVGSPHAVLDGGARGVSGVVAVDATASDNGQLASFAASGFDGFSDADTTLSRIAGDWSPASAWPDGLATIAFDACDAVWNCSRASGDVLVDRTAPVLSFEGAAPPRYTQATSLSFDVRVLDLSAVKEVWAQSGSSNPTLGVRLADAGFGADGGALPGELWRFSNLALAPGHNDFVVYGEDLATPSPNNGSARAAADGGSSPERLAFTITRDATAPTVTIAATPSYYEETNMDVERFADGVPKVPVVYTFPPSQQKVAVVNGSTIRKTTPRVTLGGSSAVELESTNPNNVPFVQFTTPYNPATDSPIVSAKVVTSWTCNPFSTCQANGVFPPIGFFPNDNPLGFRVVGNQVVSDVAFTTETGFAVLADLNPAIGNALELSAYLTFTDAAGNTSSASATVAYRFVGPPVSVRQDTSYSAAGDTKSAYAYPIAGGAYVNAFSSSNAELSNGVRLVRLLIENPIPQPIAVKVTSLPATWSVAETWSDESIVLNFSGTTSMDSFSFTNREYWNAGPENDQNWFNSNGCNLPYPCGIGTGKLGPGQKWYWHRAGDTASRYQCTTDTGLMPPQAASALAVSGVSTTPGWAVYLNPQPNGGESTLATALANGELVIPAATATAPGQAVLYVTRSVNAARVPALRYQRLAGGGLPNRIEYQHGLFWRFNRDNTLCGGISNDPTKMPEYYDAESWVKVIGSATEQLSGTLSLSSWGTRRNGTLLNGTNVGRVAAPNVPVSATVVH